MANESDMKEEGSSCGCGGGSCCSGPGKWIWIVLVLAMVGVLIAKNACRRSGEVTATEGACCGGSAAVVGGAGVTGWTPGGVPEQRLPRLVDVGAGTCIPCKMMAPILEDLRKTYAGKLDVRFIDVRESPGAGKEYGIHTIPTQIFYDVQGKELFRHEGFMAREDILAKWKELGVDLLPSGTNVVNAGAGNE